MHPLTVPIQLPDLGLEVAAPVAVAPATVERPAELKLAHGSGESFQCPKCGLINLEGSIGCDLLPTDWNRANEMLREYKKRAR